MHPRFSMTLASSLFCVAASFPAAAGQAESLADAFTDGEPILSLRYRYEDVDDGDFEKNARASTLRTVVGFRTLGWKGLSLLLEAEDVRTVGNELFNNGGAGSLDNGVRDRPVVADPSTTEINQAYLQFERGGSALRVGRREIILGDERFVSNAPWRQNHQSFDALSFESSSLQRWDLFYSYIDNVNRTNGGNQPMASHLFNAVGDLGRAGKLTLYGLSLDYEDPVLFHLSSQTIGAKLSGEHDLAETFSEVRGSLLYEIEYARQRDTGSNPGRLDVAYLNLQIGAAFAAVTVRLGFEELGGSARNGQFNTPIATLHKFNGWADRFLSTPTDGLQDTYVKLNGTLKKIGWTARYHDFRSSSGHRSYGRELDLQLLFTAPWGQVFGLTGALYGADEHAADTDKWWLFTSYQI